MPDALNDSKKVRKFKSLEKILVKVLRGFVASKDKATVFAQAGTQARSCMNHIR